MVGYGVVNKFLINIIIFNTIIKFNKYNIFFYKYNNFL